jgi:hypothetical protein
VTRRRSATSSRVVRMRGKSLTIYLNDHLAGSVAAIELLDHLVELYRGTERERLFSSLRSAVEEDRRVLQSVLEEVGGKESRVRKAAAWLTEKLGQAKFRLDDPGDLRVLETLETLGLGIQGKLALWRALATAAGRVPQLRALDLASLQRRAVEQYDRVEAERLEAARLALVL